MNQDINNPLPETVEDKQTLFELMGDDFSRAYFYRFPAMPDTVVRSIRKAFAQLDYPQPTVEAALGRAWSKYKKHERAENYLEVRWRADKVVGDSTAVAWICRRDDEPDKDSAISFGKSLLKESDEQSRGLPRKTPGLLFLGPYDDMESLPASGNLYDYSRCANKEEVADLIAGDLPLGVWSFGRPGERVERGPKLFLSRYKNNDRMEFNGTLVCAPQRSGKTTLISRWAVAASETGHNLFIVDVKGNLRKKLGAKLEGPGKKLFYFSTDPRVRPGNGDRDCDRINFLDGLKWVSPKPEPGVDYLLLREEAFTEIEERIKNIASALLPKEGWETGIDRSYYQHRFQLLQAIIHVLKLDELYKGYKNRTTDLSDLYMLVTDERFLYERLRAIQDAESRNIEKGRELELPPKKIKHWINELARILDPKEWKEAGRQPQETFSSLTYGLKLALEPFSKGALRSKTRHEGPGKLFSFEELGKTDEQVTIILAAREQDGETAETILSMAVKMIERLLFNRMDMDKEVRDAHPVLLLLDETRRIHSFKANEYITFSREAGAGCVVVYQSLTQVGQEKEIGELLENVGTQIYLGSLTGMTAEYFMRILPERPRTTYYEDISDGPQGSTKTVRLQTEKVKLLTSNELYHLPAGDWPALIYMNDQPRRKPFLVDMYEESAE
jgi:type IV secretory pathway TraG/TraD family ATPase VirD4